MNPLYRLSILLVILFGWLLYYFWNSTSLGKKEASFSSGQIIRGNLGSGHRKFIQISGDGYYIVQDFHGIGKPATNPYRIKDQDDLFRDYSEQRSIDGFYFRYDGNDGVNYFNYRNGLKDGPTANLIVILHACNYPITVSKYIKHVVSDEPLNSSETIVDIDCIGASTFVSLAFNTMSSCLPDDYKLTIVAEDKKRVLDKQQLLNALKRATYAGISDPSLCPK